jgi:hypothetical protein
MNMPVRKLSQQETRDWLGTGVIIFGVKKPVYSQAVPNTSKQSTGNLKALAYPRELWEDVHSNPGDKK